MSEYSGQKSFAEQKASETLDKQAHALAEAVEAVDPHAGNKSIFEIFPEPGERRADTEFSLPAEDEVRFREAMAKLGIGRETNLTAAEVGLHNGYVAIIEGGQAHKMAAELAVILQGDIQPSLIVIAASADRVIPPVGADKVQERETTARILGLSPDEVGGTEYEVARQVIESIPKFTKIYKDIDTGAAYDMNGELLEPKRAGEESEKPGQFAQIGWLDIDNRDHYGTSVNLLRIDREYKDDKTYKTLGAKGLMVFIDRFLRSLRAEGDIGFVTSATYQPSREIDAVSAMLEVERAGASVNVGVITYGTRELAEVKKENVPQPPALGQLAGEAHKTAKQLQALRQLLEQSNQG